MTDLPAPANVSIEMLVVSILILQKTTTTKKKKPKQTNKQKPNKKQKTTNNNKQTKQNKTKTKQNKQKTPIQQPPLPSKTTHSPTPDNDRIEMRNKRFLQSPHCAANCLQHVHSSGPGAIECKSRGTHRALITCNMASATWYDCLFVCWSLNVPATCECISGTDLHRQFYVLPH